MSTEANMCTDVAVCATAERKKVQRISELYLMDEDDELGDGSFARVFEAVHIISGEKRALKVITKSHGAVTAPRDAREADVLSAVSHPGIVKMHEVLETADNELVLSLDLWRTDLYSELTRRPRNRLTEAEARGLASQLLSAVGYLHDQDIVHRDIKPENVLLNGTGQACLADFGYARWVGAENEPVGTSFYMPPEALRALPPLLMHRQRGQQLSALEAKAGDLWSLGTVLFFALSGRPPFVGQPYPPAKRRALLEQMDAGPSFSDDRWRDVSEAARDFVRGLLTVDSSSRLTAADALRHPWLRAALPPPLPESEAVAVAPTGCRQAGLQEEASRQHFPQAVGCIG
eukprot:Hpha_TRINITY_DN16252_c0_g2::TRINITY_DN16252_c0_g2_i1::g.14948::m.14948/K06641/CHK2; serine/threonine-protein kinase Chk2